MISRQVNKADLGRNWPLKVASGMLIREGQAVFFEHNGEKYAVNGTASHLGGIDIAPIWRNASPCGEVKMNIGPLIDMGLAL